MKDRSPTRTPLALLLEQLRTEAGLSQYALAAKCGFDRSNIRRIEDGSVADITEDKMRVLADALDVDVERFYEAHWLTVRRPLPSLPTYFRSKYKDLTAAQIADVAAIVDTMRTENADDHTA